MNRLLNISDKTALGLSIACALHCIAVPFILIALPSLSGLMMFDERFHLWLVFAVVPISLFAITYGYFYHRNRKLIYLSGLGMALLIAAVLFGHDVLGHMAEVALTIVGSGLIAYCHIRNVGLRRQQFCENQTKVSV